MIDAWSPAPSVPHGAPADASATQSSCRDRIDTVAAGLIDAGFRIGSRYEPNERRPGVITARSLAAGMESLTVMTHCEPRFHYEIGGSGILGLTGRGRRRARTAIDARLAGSVAAFVEEEASPIALPVRTWPQSVELLSSVGVSALEVEVRNRSARTLLVHAGAVGLETPDGTVLGSMDASQIGNRLALQSHALDQDTVRLLSARQLKSVRLAPGEAVRGLVYFHGAPRGRPVVRALTDDLQEVLLVGSVVGEEQSGGDDPQPD